jgi:hypothetical protein
MSRTDGSAVPRLQGLELEREKTNPQRGGDPDTPVRLLQLGTFWRDRILTAAAFLLVAALAYNTGRLVGTANVIERTAPMYEITHAALDNSAGCIALARDHVGALYAAGLLDRAGVWVASWPELGDTVKGGINGRATQ